MLRDKNLIPLSRQHQHALALCVRLDRALQAGKIDLESWQAEIAQLFEQEITTHFAAEEKYLFPATTNFPELRPLVQELLEEHAQLRNFFARAQSRSLDRAALSSFASTLAQHIRKEERRLFEGMQNLMSTAELLSLGNALDQALEAAVKACSLPNPPARPES